MSTTMARVLPGLFSGGVALASRGVHYYNNTKY